jgi:hypothetical protein
MPSFIWLPHFKRCFGSPGGGAAENQKTPQKKKNRRRFIRQRLRKIKQAAFTEPV